jgi:hypothetical protein
MVKVVPGRLLDLQQVTRPDLFQIPQCVVITRNQQVLAVVQHLAALPMKEGGGPSAGDSTLFENDDRDGTACQGEACGKPGEAGANDHNRSHCARPGAAFVAQGWAIQLYLTLRLSQYRSAIRTFSGREIPIRREKTS